MGIKTESHEISREQGGRCRGEHRSTDRRILRSGSNSPAHGNDELCPGYILQPFSILFCQRAGMEDFGRQRLPPGKKWFQGLEVYAQEQSDGFERARGSLVRMRQACRTSPSDEVVTTRTVQTVIRRSGIEQPTRHIHLDVSSRRIVVHGHDSNTRRTFPRWQCLPAMPLNPGLASLAAKKVSEQLCFGASDLREAGREMPIEARAVNDVVVDDKW